MKLEQLADRYNQTGQLPVIYIAGPMSGLPNHNFEAFNTLARQYRTFGFPVLNPADFGAGEFTAANDNEALERAYQNAMARDLPLVASADVVVFLEGWEESRGANMEFEVASALGKVILDFENDPGENFEFVTAFYTPEYAAEFIRADIIAETARQMILDGMDVSLKVTIEKDQLDELIAQMPRVVVPD